MPKTVDAVAARELFLFATNDGDLYYSRVTPIIANLARKIAAGTYDQALALKLWRYAADDAAKRYTAQFGGAFNVATRGATAVKLDGYYDEDIRDAADTLATERANRKRWTLAAIKAANESAGWHFFDRCTMKFFGDTMSSFAVRCEGCDVYIERVKSPKEGLEIGKRWKFDTESAYVDGLNR